ncbi:hypothetical protein M6B22_20255 [Jatrophihabitans cynanchi]|jgi:hypothetical protein|uniref:Uncharacterized protein n=1 Tax=Jatrophihabitans cynanchi TaxID=2944128 RepID=A0ABY7JYP0_9ACTN|nr:hypothetical protein [Jatrophihabitans sp. SB3-54]WAX56835.1 hypothetical protein M6B22_20255 [Jatrophihabitans sp. SB3-54]
MQDDAPEPTAGPVVTAIALGVAPLPLLAVYAVVFIAHGTLYPVNPPDITGSKGGELLAGVAALVLFALVTCTIVWFMNRRRRWPFLLAQLATLATAVWFVIDSRTGPPGVPVLLVITSAVALALAVLPVSAAHVHGAPARSVA